MNNPLLAPRIILVFTPRRRRPQGFLQMHPSLTWILFFGSTTSPPSSSSAFERRPARPREVVALVRGALAAAAATAANDLFGLG
jgi:hypothetical protein